MNKRTNLIFTILVLITLVVSDKQQAIELTDDQFIDFVTKTKNVIVLFYNKKNCTTCPEIEADTIESIKNHQPEGQKWTFAKFNVHKYHEFAKIFHVNSTPRIRFYFDFEFFSSLHSKPTKEGIDEFLKKLSVPAPRPKAIYNEADEAEFKSQKIAVLCSFPLHNDRSFYFTETLQKVFPDIPVYTTLTKTKFDMELFGDDNSEYKILLKRDYDDGNKKLTSHTFLNAQTAIHMIDRNKRERIRPLDKKAFDQIMTYQHSFIIILDHLTDSASVAAAKNYLLGLNYSGEVFTSNLKEGPFCDKLAKILGINEQEFPIMMIVKTHPARFQKYKYAGNFSQQSISKFMNNYFESKVPEYVRSDAVIPNKGKSIADLVASNYNDFIESSKSHVLVLFYGEHEGNADQIKKQLRELYKLIHEKNNIIFAQTNIELNDYPTIPVRTIPELFFYHLNNKKEPVRYTLSGHTDDFVEFFKDQLQTYIFQRTEYERAQMSDL